MPGEITLTYSQIDRIIVGGICPTSKALEFAPELGKHTGTDFFLERRELGLINIGGDAAVTIDGVRFEVKTEEALYVGMGRARDSIRKHGSLASRETLFQQRTRACGTLRIAR